MDPVTAGLNAFGEFCKLLQTPEGQKVMNDTNNALHGAIVGITNFFHNHFQSHTPAQPTSPESNSSTPKA